MEISQKSCEKSSHRFRNVRMEIPSCDIEKRNARFFQLKKVWKVSVFNAIIIITLFIRHENLFWIMNLPLSLDDLNPHLRITGAGKNQNIVVRGYGGTYAEP